MKAFLVSYKTGGKQVIQYTVLSESQEDLEQSLSEKDRDYKIGRPTCQITDVKEIPLSNVLIQELTITELLKILNVSK